MKHKYDTWKHSIVNFSIYDCDGDFVDKSMIEHKCDCIHKEACLKILELLKFGKEKDGLDLVEKLW